MSNFNRVILAGHMTRDPEVREIRGGSSVANIGLAINRKWTDKPSGEKREEVTYVDCEAWGATGTAIAKFFRKGSPILIEGRLRMDSWETNGERMSKLKVVVESFDFLAASPKEEGPVKIAPRSRPAHGVPVTPMFTGPVTPMFTEAGAPQFTALTDDEIPF